MLRNRKQSTTVRAGVVIFAGTPSNSVSTTPYVRDAALNRVMRTGSLPRAGTRDLWGIAIQTWCGICVPMSYTSSAVSRQTTACRARAQTAADRMVARDVGTRLPVEAPPFALDQTEVLQAPKLVVADAGRLRVTRTEERTETRLGEPLVYRGFLNHRASNFHKNVGNNTPMPTISRSMSFESSWSALGAWSG